MNDVLKCYGQKSIPVTQAKRLAREYGYNQILILAIKEKVGSVACVTTYGNSNKNSDEIGSVGSDLVRIIGYRADGVGGPHAVLIKGGIGYGKKSKTNGQ